jgi:hypothetical protein
LVVCLEALGLVATCLEGICLVVCLLMGQGKFIHCI